MDYQSYLQASGFTTDEILLGATYRTNAQELAWAAILNGWIPPSVAWHDIVVPDGESAPAQPTAADDLASLKAWSEAAFKRMIADALKTTKARLEERRKRAELHATIEATKQFIESKIDINIS